jgi:ATP-binding cassette subfamily B protein
LSDSPVLSQPQPKDLSAWRTLARLSPFLAPYKTRVAVAAIALLVAAAATLAIPAAFRILIDQGFTLPDMGSEDSWQVNKVFLQLLVVALILAIATSIRFYCVSWLGDRITADLRNAVFRQVLHQDPEFFETLRTGEVQSRLSSDTTLIQLRIPVKLAGDSGTKWPPYQVNARVMIVALAVVTLAVFAQRAVDA